MYHGLTQPPLVMNDFLRALHNVRPSVSAADSMYRRLTAVQKHLAFTQEAGIK